MKKNLSVFLFMVMAVYGCSSVPFKTVKLNRIDENPDALVQNFAQKLPASFEITESVVFRYHRREMTAVAHTLVDPSRNLTASAGLTPSGVKVFELKQEGENLEYSFLLPKEAQEKLDQAKTARAMAEDMRRVYRGFVPDGSHPWFPNKKRNRVEGLEILPHGMMRYVFGGPHQALLEKTFIERGDKKWRVRYFDYRVSGNKLYPSEVFYENFKGKYSVALRLKEIAE